MIEPPVEIQHFTRIALQRLAISQNGLTAAEARQGAPNRMKTLLMKGWAQALPTSAQDKFKRYKITKAGREVLRTLDER